LAISAICSRDSEQSSISRVSRLGFGEEEINVDTPSCMGASDQLKL
jgi:hypothetical protein